MTAEDIDFKISLSADTSGADAVAGGLDEAGAAADRAKKKIGELEEKGLEVKGDVVLDDAAAKQAIADLEGKKVKVKVEADASSGAAAPSAQAAPKAAPAVPVPAASAVPSAPSGAGGGARAQGPQDIKLTAFGEMPRTTMQRIAGGVDKIKDGVAALGDAAKASAQGGSAEEAGAEVVVPGAGTDAAKPGAAKVDKAGLEKAKADILSAVKALDDAAASYGGESADKVRKTLSAIRDTVAKTGNDNLKASFLEIAKGLQAIVDEGNKLPPEGLDAMGNKIVSLVGSTREFAAAMRRASDVKIDVDLSGIDGLELIEDKLQVIREARGLDAGIKELDAALLALDPKKAEDFVKELDRIRELLSKKMDASNLKEIDDIIASIEKRASGLKVEEFERIGSSIAKLRTSFSGLRDAAQGIGAELRDEFNAANFVTSVFSGNVAGITKGVIGIASGAKVAGAALRTMLASTVVGAIVAAVAAIGAGIAKWVKHLRNAKFEAQNARFEQAQNSIAEANALMERRIRIIDIEKQMVDATTARYKEQLTVVKELMDAQDSLNRERELANAKTEREREEIIAKYAARKESREQSAGLAAAAADYVNYMKTLEKDKAAMAERDAAHAKSLEKTARLREQYEQGRAIAQKYGLGIQENPETGTLVIHSMEDMLRQWAYNTKNYIGLTTKPVDLKIPQEIVEEWKKTVHLMYIGNQEGAGKWVATPKAFTFGLPDLDRIIEKLVSQFNVLAQEENRLIEKAKALENERADIAWREREGAANKRSQVDKAVAAQTEEGMARANANTKQREEFENQQRIMRRDFARSREDAYAYDNERAGLTERRMQEHRGYADAYMNGGTDEYGRKIDVGISGIKAEEEKFRKMVGDTVEMRKAAALRDAKGSSLMSEREMELARQWDAVKNDYKTLEKRVQENAAKLPGLMRRFEAQQTAMNQLVLAMDALAMSYREEARQTRLEDANRRRSRAEAERRIAYGQQGRGSRLVEDERMEAVSGRRVRRLEADIDQDQRNRDRFADLRQRENSGENLTRDEEAFLDAFEDKDKQAKVQRADELEYRDLVQEDLNAEEKKELEALKAETKEYRIVAQRVVEARRRQLEFEEQRREAAREAAEQAKREIEKDNEERTHSMGREDRLAVWDRQYGKQGSYGKLGMAIELEKSGTERFNAADRLLRYEDRGMRDEDGNRLPADEIIAAIESLGVKMTDKEKAGIGANRMDENIRARIERARNEGREDQRRGRQERWSAEDAARESEVKFRLGQVRQGNRLTQMGLGGDVTGGWQRETANNTKEMCKLGGKIITTLKGMQDTRRMFGTNGSTWAMR